VEGTPFGRYRLVELLGRGGMGEVWRAFDSGTDRVVALKVLPANFADDQLFQERFRREARAAAGLDDPHVVPIYDFGEIEGRFFVSMRLVQGQDLHTLLGSGSLDPTRAVGIISQIASALHAAHRIGLVHRDVKPSNILVAEDDFAYLIDFGIARAAGETGLTNTGATVGTWAYMAPERFRKGATDSRADVYALTCVLHESLIGKPPFPGDTLEQVAVAHMLEPPPRPSALRGGIPAGLDEVIATGMAKDPDQRYATTKDLALAAHGALTTPIPRPNALSTPRAEPRQPQTQQATPPPAPVIGPPPAPLFGTTPPPAPVIGPPRSNPGPVISPPRSDLGPVIGPPPRSDPGRAPLHGQSGLPKSGWPGDTTSPTSFAPRGAVGPGAGFSPPPPPAAGYPPQTPGGLVTLPGVGTVTVATIWQRLGARLIDWLLNGVVYVACSVIFGLLASSTETVTDAHGNTTTQMSGSGPLSLLAFGVAAGICVLYEWLMVAYKGATLGKMALGIKVVDETGGQILGRGRAFLRTVIPFAAALACCLPGLLVYLSPVFDRSGRLQGWHDKAAHDLVIKSR
jgi:serine/threonine protein kinase/uncharacterized RDD family membrane protein YckC